METLNYLNGEKTRLLIAKKGLTITAFADKGNISPSLICNWMNGKVRIRLDTLCKIARMLGKEPQDLIINDNQL